MHATVCTCVAGPQFLLCSNTCAGYVMSCSFSVVYRLPAGCTPSTCLPCSGPSAAAAATASHPAWWQPEAQLRPALLIALHNCTPNSLTAMASPQVFRDAAAMRAWSREQRRQGKTTGFVPTMVRHAFDHARLPCGCRHAPFLTGSASWLQGYLHEGHISLVKAAK